jgi:hypothetical protein
VERLKQIYKIKENQMKSKEFRNLLSTATTIVDNKNRSSLNESVKVEKQPENNLVENINSVLENVENQLKIKLTEEEVIESTKMILEWSVLSELIESIQNDVGFELTENEVEYVIDKLKNQ